MSQEFETVDLSGAIPSQQTEGSIAQSSSGVAFNNDLRSHSSPKKRFGLITQLVIKYSGGKISNENEANVVLLVAVVVIFILAIFIATHSGSTSAVVSDAELKADQLRMSHPVNLPK